MPKYGSLNLSLDPIYDIKSFKEFSVLHVLVTLTAGKKTFGVRLKDKQHNYVILEDLLNEQKLLQNEIDPCQDKRKRQEIRKNRSKIMKKIRKRIRILQR